MLLRAFEALREHVPARLTVIGAGEGELAPLLDDTRGVTALGRVDDAEKRAALERAHVLCAPSLGGESFGMVLTEAFAAGTPVVASDIAGYRDVVDATAATGCSSRPATPSRSAEALHDLALDAPRLERLAVRAGRARRALRLAARRRAGAWRPTRTRSPSPLAAGATARAAVQLGFRSAAGGPRRPARRLPPLEPRPTRAARAAGRRAAPRRWRASPPSRGVGALLALQRIGWDAIGAVGARLEPGLGAAGGRADVSSRWCCARSSWHAILQGRAAGGARRASPTRSRARRSAC